MVVVMIVVLFAQISLWQLAKGTLQTEHALASFAMLSHLETTGTVIWQFFFTLHLLLLGYLVNSSARFPKILGIGLMIGSVGYALDSLLKLQGVETGAMFILCMILLGIVSLSEIGFALYLLIKGQRVTH